MRAVGRAIADGIGSEDFRGCAFLNAAAEYPDPAHPIHQAVLAHRQWFLGTVTDLLARVGNAPAEPAGRHFVMLRDGAMAAGCLSEPGLITETFMEGVEGILRARSGAGPAGPRRCAGLPDADSPWSADSGLLVVVDLAVGEAAVVAGGGADVVEAHAA